MVVPPELVVDVPPELIPPVPAVPLIEPLVDMPVVLLLAPLVFDSSIAISMMAQMGIAIIACLSFNMLLGQGGMLSFGHAV